MKKTKIPAKWTPKKKNFDGVPLVVAAKLVFPEKKILNLNGNYL